MRGQLGMTLLEMAFTLAIAIVLVTVAVPGMLDWIRDVRQDTGVLDMVSYLNYARSEAVKRGYRVTVCPSEDGARCLGQAIWEKGWIAFDDVDGDGTVDTHEDVLRVHGPLAASDTLRGGRHRITYQSSGFSRGFNDTLKLCDGRGNEKAKSMVISMQGRVRIQAGAKTCP